MMGELVMAAFATLDQVAFIRSASVYRNFREPRISANSSDKSRRLTIDASCHNWFPSGGAGG
jgi:transcriptional regulator NrdR family protein